MPPPARPAAQLREWTVAELAERFGSLPSGRIRTEPSPGTATRADAERARAEGAACELIDGTLVEKAMSQETATLAARIIWLLSDFLERRSLGFVVGADGYVDLYGGTLQRAPDVSVVLDEQQPDGPLRRALFEGIGAEGAPALCVEVFSPSNTRPEMQRKRTEYFENGCRLCWTVHPAADTRPATIEVHTPATGPAEGAGTVLGEADALTADPVLPGFRVPVARVFRRGS